MSSASVTVVLPAYNEQAILKRTTETIVETLRERDANFEVIIVENGSSDNTREIGTALATEYGEVKFESLNIADYGAALKRGLQNAKNDIVVNFDCDYYDTDFLFDAVELFAKETDLTIIVGSKRAPGSADTRSWHRRLVTRVFSTLLKKAFGLQRSDTHGMKAMRREVVSPFIEKCLLTQDLFDTELILRCERAGLKTGEIPVPVIEQRPARSSIVRRIPRTIRGLIRLYAVLRKVPFAAPSSNSEAEAA